MNYSKFHKRKVFLSLLQQLSVLEGSLTLHPPVPSKKRSSWHLQLGREENNHERSILFIEYSIERRACWFVLKVSRYSLSNTKSRKRMVSIVLMVNITHICKRINLCSLLTWNLIFIASKQRIFWRWTHNFSVNKLTKKVFTGTMNCYICFFIGVAIKLVVSTIQLATGNSVNSSLTSTMDKTYHGPVTAPFSEETLKCF